MFISSFFLLILIKFTNLKEKKALSKCQQVIFASISNEFGIPLNTFMNPLELIDVQIIKIKNQIYNKAILKLDFDVIFK